LNSCGMTARSDAVFAPESELIQEQLV
jgi:hypothetical protein